MTEEFRAYVKSDITALAVLAKEHGGDEALAVASLLYAVAATLCLHDERTVRALCDHVGPFTERLMAALESERGQ